MTTMFTDRARKAMAIANQRATRDGVAFIVPEHIAAALLSMPRCTAMAVLGSTGADREKVLERLEESLRGRGGDLGRPGRSRNGETMKVIEAAAEEARTLGHEHVGTEHLLLGLVAEGAPAVLAALGSEVGDLGRLRSVARELLPRGVERAEIAIEASAAEKPAPARPDRPPGAIAGSLAAAAAALRALLADDAAVSSVEDVVSLLAERFRAGQKVLVCGNGGSACDAAHFAEELTGRFRAPPRGKADRPALPAIACTDVGHITCTANDYGFEHVFSRWVEALGKPGDVLIVLSTSGNSANVVKAAEAGRARGLTTVALLGKDGGRLRGACDHEIIVPGEGSDRVQELHMLILHAMVEGVEREMFGW